MPAAAAAATGGNTGADLTESDLSLLRKWVNPAYLKQESWAKISSKMDEDGSVQLQRFLLKDISDQILKCCLDTDLQDEVGGGKIPIFETGYGNGEPLDLGVCRPILQESVYIQSNTTIDTVLISTFNLLYIYKGNMAGG